MHPPLLELEVDVVDALEDVPPVVEPVLLVELVLPPVLVDRDPLEDDEEAAPDDDALPLDDDEAEEDTTLDEATEPLLDDELTVSTPASEDTGGGGGHPTNTHTPTNASTRRERMALQGNPSAALKASSRHTGAERSDSLSIGP
ncbi:MAG: hypothetical protein AB2A00_27330 [Myxococcota bacterium]